MLSGGNVHDVSLAKELLSDMQAKAVLADKAYNSRNLIAMLLALVKKNLKTHPR